VSSTFQGRDVFAPVAGHLSTGVQPQRFGNLIRDEVRLPSPAVRRRKNGTVECRVIHIDHFGNLITNIDRGVVGETC